MIDLSVNISTYNNINFLRLCLDSILRKIEGLKLEIIVVDNASTDGTAEMLRDHFPEVIVVKNSLNRGVAPSRNQSIKISGGKYILLLDADTELISEDFPDLIEYMDSQPDVALVGVKQLTADNRFYPAARTFPGVKHIVMRRLSFFSFIKQSKIIKDHHLSFINSDSPVQVDYVIGAFQLIKRDVFESVGLLDEKMFYGFEDSDFCARIKKSGYKVVYYPQFEIRHYVQGLTRKRRLFSKTGIKLLFNHFKSYARFYAKQHDVI